MCIGGALGSYDARAHLAASAPRGPALAVMRHLSKGTGGLALRVAF
jgi:hypothetical protein